eukprot:EG_transcript_7144
MPERYLCPITTEIMVDPVMDLHGHNFERSAIAEWLGRSEECPLSREPIHLHTLYPNLALKEEIAEWLARSHPMFGADDTSSFPGSPTTSPPPATTPETGCPAADPWEKLAMDQAQYDRLLAVFLSSGCEKGDRSKLQDLCRYMNFVEAMDHVEELLPGEAKASVAFDDFMAFVQKYPPRPVLEYGMSQEEYADVLEKFQALDGSIAGKVSREAALALAEDPPLGCSPTALLDALPEGQVTLHDVLGCVKRCRLLVARRRSVLSPAAHPLGTRPRGSVRPAGPGAVKGRPSAVGTSGCQEGPSSPSTRGSPASCASPQSRRFANAMAGWPAGHRSPPSHRSDSPLPRPAASPASLSHLSPPRARPTRSSDASASSVGSVGSIGSVDSIASDCCPPQRAAPSARSESPLPSKATRRPGKESPQPLAGRPVKPLLPAASQAPPLRRTASQLLGPRSANKPSPGQRCEVPVDDALPPRGSSVSVIVTDRRP